MRPVARSPDGRYTVRVGGFDRAGNPTVRDGDDPRRPDDPVARLGTRLVRAAGRRPRPPDVRPPPTGDGLGGDLPGVRPSSAGSGRAGRSPPGRTAGRGTARRLPGHSSSRARTGSWSTRRAGSARRGPAAPSPSRHRSRPRDPTRLGVHDRPQPDDDRAGSGRARGPGLDRPADLQRGRERRPMTAAILAALPARDAPRRRRRLARRHGPARRRAGGGRPAHPRPPSRPEAGPRPRLPRRLRRRAGRRRDHGRPDGRRLQPRPGGAARSGRPDRRRHGRPRHRLPLHARRRRRRLGARPADRVTRRQPLRADRARSGPERPDRRVQGVARRRRSRRSRSTGSMPAATSSRSR